MHVVDGGNKTFYVNIVFLCSVSFVIIKLHGFILLMFLSHVFVLVYSILLLKFMFFPFLFLTLLKLVYFWNNLTLMILEIAS